jgi:hypothetical protein
MDRLNGYRQIVQQALLRHAELPPSHGQIESIPIFDERNDQYLLIDYGWDRTGRAYTVVAHVRIKDGKIWIERDGMEDGLAEEFVQAGVPREDIVLAFYRPERRRITEFAAD